MQRPRCIRIFKTKEQALLAKAILQKAHIPATIKEDTFGDIKLPDIGIQARFRLYIEQRDISKAGMYLVIELAKTRITS